MRHKLVYLFTLALIAVGLLFSIPAYAQGFTFTSVIVGNPTSINAGTTYSILDTVTNTSGSSKLYTINHDLDYAISPGWPTGWFLTEGASTFGGGATGGSCVDGGIPNPSNRNCTFTLANGATGTVTTPFKAGTCFEHPVAGYTADLWNNGNLIGGFDNTYLSGTGLASQCSLNPDPMTQTKSRNTVYTINAQFTTTRSPTWAGTIRFNDATSTVQSVSNDGSPASCSVINSHRAECTYSTMGDGVLLSMTVTYKTANFAYNVWRNFVVFNSNSKYQTHQEGLLTVP